MANLMGLSGYISTAIVLLLLFWKVMLFISNPKRIKFNLPNFIWYDQISISATYSESGKQIKVLSNRLSIAIAIIAIAEILLNFIVLMMID